MSSLYTKNACESLVVLHVIENSRYNMWNERLITPLLSSF